MLEGESISTQSIWVLFVSALHMKLMHSMCKLYICNNLPYFRKWFAFVVKKLDNLQKILLVRSIFIVLFYVVDGCRIYQGSEVIHWTITGNLEGLFFSMDTIYDVMSLSDVVLHPSGEKRQGFCHLHRNDVIYGKFICQHIHVWSSWLSFGSYAEDSETFIVYSKTLLIRSA